MPRMPTPEPAPLDDAELDLPRARAAAINARGRTLYSTIKGLWPHLWPAARADLKLRVVMAFVLLVAARWPLR